MHFSAAPFGLGPPAYDHAVMFYLEEDFLLRTLCQLMAGSFQADSGAVILSTAAHNDGLVHGLSRQGIDVPALKSKGSYAFVDANEILSECMVNGRLDSLRLNLLLGGVLAGVKESTASTNPRVTIYGELVNLLWERRDIEAVLAVEEFWNQRVDGVCFSLICSYAIAEFERAGTEDSFVQICATHPTVVPPESYASPESEKRIMEALARSYANHTPENLPE